MKYPRSVETESAVEVTRDLGEGETGSYYLVGVELLSEVKKRLWKQTVLVVHHTASALHATELHTFKNS